MLPELPGLHCEWGASYCRLDWLGVKTVNREGYDSSGGGRQKEQTSPVMRTATGNKTYSWRLSVSDKLTVKSQNFYNASHFTPNFALRKAGPSVSICPNELWY